MEGEALWAFEHRFGTVPLANLDIPESKLGDGYSNLVSITCCDGSSESLTIDDLAARLGRAARVEEATPIINPNAGATITLGADTNGTLSVLGRYRAVRLVPLETVRREEKDRIQRLAGTNYEHVAAWPVEKMRALIALAGALTPEKTRAKTVKRFQTPSPEVPKPHTWGEVAVVLGRALLGCWYPDKRFTVKILCGEELLGEATFADWWFDGSDISDLPQRDGPRPSYWDTHDSPKPPTCSQRDYVEATRTSGFDEDTEEEYTEIVSELTDEASERSQREWREYDRCWEEQVKASCEAVYRLAVH
ncbi:MAG: hypothetical protein NTW96_03385 [Planctomycetia bacterium]|nr:hypothetical protein [Planctomycetia bacterium]